MADSKSDVAALIAQIPDTDHQKKNAGDADAAGVASKFTGPEPAEAEKIFAGILAGGPAGISDLVAAVHAPSDAEFRDYKAGYVLHGLCVRAGTPGKGEQRAMIAAAVASRLQGGKASAAARRLLIQELQVAGGPESIPALTACLGDAELCESAVQALIAIRDGAAEPLRKALESAKGRCLAAVVQALGVLQDKSSLPALRKLLNSDEPDVRRVAAWALANTADAESTDALLKFADAAAAGWERSHATGICHALAERLAAAGQKDAAIRIYSHLRDTRKDPDERYVSESAARALQALQ
jgi:hypothetical protein